MSNKYVLAMYDVRGKQEYIYRSNKIKTIIGGSLIISDCFKDYLFPAAIKYRDSNCETKISGEAIFDYKMQENKGFSTDNFESRMQGNQYLGEVIYEGGGNFFVLYKDEDACREINKIFTRELLEKTQTLKCLCSYITGVSFDDYRGDETKLRSKHRINEAVNNPGMPAQVLPFTKVDRKVNQPIYINQYSVGRGLFEDVTKEDYAKYSKYKEYMSENTENTNELILDNLVTKKGEESLLAIIYIDGNNMGARVHDHLQEMKTYEECINALRNLSSDIQKNCIDDRKNSIAKVLKSNRRFIIENGDEMTLIVNARDAYNVVKAYFENMPAKWTACAGIAIFHSHTPFSDAYRIAEACCESGKDKIKEVNNKYKLDIPFDANMVDFHYLQSGIGVDLEKIRIKEVGNIISKPWMISQ